MGKKILLADDSITIQKVIELTFSDEDFEVVTVGNGRLAIEKLEEVRPDIVLCDIIMPEKDGYEVCDHIKKHPTLSAVPVLLLTGAFEPFDQERASRVGCDGFLAKPFEPQALIGKVKDLLAQSAARPRPSAAAVPPALIDGMDAQTMPRTPTFVTQPVPPASAAPEAAPAAAAMSFAPEEPAVEEAPPGSFEAPMELSTGPDEAAPYEQATGIEQDLFSMDEPVVASPEEFMPLMADEAEALQPLTTMPAVPAFAPEPEAAFEAEPQPAFELPPPPPAFVPRPAFIAAPPPAFEPPRLEPAAFAPPPAPEPPPLVAEDDDASTLLFHSGEAAPWAQPTTTELSFEMRAQAMAKQQAEAVAAPVFEETVEEEGFAAAPPAGFEREPEPAPKPPPRLAAEEPEESFAGLATPAFEAPTPSAAAQVAVPVDQVAQIAQRVVAQISEKIVREIAWEVIPDLAEALIKKEIERLKAELDRT
jgi:CheY-like chemotaxis protein